MHRFKGWAAGVRAAAIVLGGLVACAVPLVASMLDVSATGGEGHQAASSNAKAAFEVASIKPIPEGRSAPPEAVLEMLWRMEPPQHGRVRMQAVTLRTLIQRAYDVKSVQVVDGPDWVGSARFDIDARAAGDATFEQMKPMLRALLADRFKLVLREESRTLPTFELLAAQGGKKIAAMKEGDCITLGPNAPAPKVAPPPAPMPNVCGWMRRVIISPPPAVTERIEGAGVSVQDLIATISSEVDRVIVDQTKFTDKFSFRLDFAPVAPAGGHGAKPFAGGEGGGAAAAPSGPSIFDALKEQLGLELKRSNGPAKVFVISQVERPTPD